MKYLISLFLFVAFAVSSFATDRVTADATFALVSAANTASSSGDTITVPAGSANWGTNTLALKDGVTLRGSANLNPQTTRTINGNTYNIPAPTTAITFSGTAVSITPGSDTTLTRVTGFEFIQTDLSHDGSITITGKNYAGTGTTVTKCRIDNNKFTKGDRQVATYGWAYPLIDHNYFLNGNISVAPSGDGEFASSPAWARAIVPGTFNAIFIEYNTFVMDTSYTDTNKNQMIYCVDGSRVTTRYNYVDTTLMTSDDTFWYDSHGNFKGGSTVSPTGTSALETNAQPLLELYGNTVRLHHSYDFADFRGGSVIMHDEIYSTVTGTVGFTLREEEVAPYTLFSPLRVVGNTAPDGYPAQQQIANTFFYNNTANGGSFTFGTNGLSRTVTTNNALEDGFIQINRDYWTVAPSGSNGNPAGIYNGYTIAGAHPLVSGVDSTAPTPNPSTIASTTVLGTSSYSVTATTATDTETPPVLYRFSKDGGSSWTAYQSSATYTFTGLTANTGYPTQVQAEDSATVPNVTTASGSTTVTTQAVAVATPKGAGSNRGHNRGKRNYQ